MLKESSHTATLVPGQSHQESKPEVLTAAAEANVSTLGLPEVSGKGSSTSEAEDGAVPKPDGAAEVAFEAGGECSERVMCTGRRQPVESPCGASSAPVYSIDSGPQHQCHLEGSIPPSPGD